jgi:hypothetical protein
MSRYRPTVRTALALSALAAMAACSDSPVASPTMQAPESAAMSKAEADDPIVDGEILVKLRDGSSVTIDAIASQHGAKKGAKGYKNAFDILHTSKGKERAFAARIASDTNVEYA